MIKQAVAALDIPLVAYLELTKPRIISLVLVASTVGFVLGSGGDISTQRLMFTLVGTALCAGGAGALNHVLDRDEDAKMHRTRNRPIPSGLITPNGAFRFGAGLSIAGLLLLIWQINLLTAALGLLTTCLYILVYTPLKRWSWICTAVGAVPGALPPLGGWAAATGRLDIGAFALFMILFLWQQPHFYAIAWMFREDYQRSIFKMLPVVDPGGRRTFRQIALCLVLLLPTSLLPAAIGLTGVGYCIGAVLLGIGFLVPGFRLAHTGSNVDARSLLRASVIYLPFLMALVLIDRAF